MFIAMILFLLLAALFFYVWGRLPYYAPYHDRSPEQQQQLRLAALFVAGLCLVLAILSVIVPVIT